MKWWQNTRLLVLILVLLGLATRVVGLGHPHEVVFDEVHFGKFVTAYCCTGERIFDIHPPHGKLLIAGVAKLFGYSGGADFEYIGQTYGRVSPISLRLFPAIVGVLLPLIVFGVLLQLGVSKKIAFLAGLFLVFDNALIVQSRVISLDMLLLVVTFGSLWAYLKGGRAWFMLSGALAGLAFGTKFTGLLALGLIGVLMLVDLIRTREYRRVISGGVIVLLSAMVIYVVGWWLHFALLPYSGPGDVWYERTGNWVVDMVTEHRRMFDANYNLTASHHDASRWWGWPFMHSPVFYWAGSSATIYLLGNPIVWWGSLALLVLAIFNFRFSIFKQRVALVFLGYIMAYVPFMRIPRALFLYHYFTPLVFSLLIGFVWLDRVKIKSEERKDSVILSLAVLLFLGYLVFWPLTYGLAIGDFYFDTVFRLFPSWR